MPKSCSGDGRELLTPAAGLSQPEVKWRMQKTSYFPRLNLGNMLHVYLSSKQVRSQFLLRFSTV